MMFSKMTLPLVCIALAANVANAGAIRTFSGLNTLERGDDTSQGPVDIGFNLNFYGLNTGSVFVNMNGNVTFSGNQSKYTPSPIESALAILAPFWADVDTRSSTSSQVQYGQVTLDSRAAFVVNWVGVNHYMDQFGLTDQNSFQLVIIDRPDTGVDGNFDFEFNYDQILWELGEASGGYTARAGWSNGKDKYSELAGSGVAGVFLDNSAYTDLGKAGGLVANNNQGVNGVDGRYLFQVRNPTTPPTGVPEPETLTLLGLGLLGVVFARRKDAC